MSLDGSHLIPRPRRFQHLHGGFLEWHIGTTIEVGTAGADGFDEILWPVSIMLQWIGVFVDALWVPQSTQSAIQAVEIAWSGHQ